ncbi:hypothetical protein AB0B03_30905 [Micromonospora chalcea]
MRQAVILVQEAYLTHPSCDPPQNEEQMRRLLAAVYESGDLNILRGRVEVLTYARRPDRPRNEPDCALYEIRYRPAHD